MRLLAVLVAVAAVAVLLYNGGNAGAAAREDYSTVSKLCVSFQDGDSSGLTCIPDSSGYSAEGTSVRVVHTHRPWNAVLIKIGNGPRLVCLQHTDRSYTSKGGWSGNSGLGCVKPQGGFSGGYSINGQQLAGPWWWNRVSMTNQGHLNCLTWDDGTGAGAGVWCERGLWPADKPSVQGTRINGDWWLNRVWINGQRTLLCPTWGTGDNGSGGVDCFVDSGWTGLKPTLSAVKPKGSEWGLNELHIPGVSRHWCLAWDGGGSDGGSGGLSCFQDDRNLDGQALQATTPVRLGSGWDVWRVTIPVS